MTIFFRLLESDDKGTALHQAIQQLAQQQPNPITFAVEPESFQQVPGAPFAYWVSEKIRNLFLKLPPFESEERTVKQGLATANDFCFLRVWWEVPKTKIVSGSATSTLDELRQKTFENKQWVSFAKGGEYSPYYADLHLVVDWEKDGQPVKAKKLHDLTIGRITANNSKCWNEGSYFRAGLTWSQRTQKGLNVRPLPSGCIFGHKGSSGFSSKNEELPFLIGLMNSSAFCRLTELLTCFGSFNEGVIKRVILPSSFSDAEKAELSTLAQHIWLLKRSLDIVIQTSHAFVLPALLQVNGRNLSDGSLRSRAHVWMNKVITVEIELAQIQSKIDDLVFDLYGISEGDRVSLNSSNSVSELAADSDDDDEDSSSAADLSSLTSELLAYTLSVAFGHFDVRLATGDRPLPTEPEPFDPLPVCSPGMLVDENGLPPTEARSLPADYAIVIPFNGILVDDEGHPNDIISHIRDVLKIIWGDQDSDIEQEACEILKVNSLRDYFRKPAAFFNDHLSRYSKSRRQAPIYLPLSTRSGSYTLWLYYHRLTDQTLYTCINDYLEPKFSRTSETVNSLRSKTGRSPNDEKTLEDLQTLEAELTELRDQLLHVARLPWNPNLNDGVQITVAPLHSLFRLGKWQKKLKETWDKLEKGDYDWAHLAHSIWTKRVREKCQTDKSLAIAHNLEDLYEPPPETPKRTKSRRKAEP